MRDASKQEESCRMEMVHSEVGLAVAARNTATANYDVANFCESQVVEVSKFPWFY